MTERERDEQDLAILRMIDAGHTQPQVAARMGLTLDVVRGRVTRLRKAMRENP